MRRVVAAALVDRAPLEQPRDRHERGVEDRHGEDQDRQHERGDGRPGDAPARGEPERGEREADREAAGVAHEDAARGRGPEVERQEADARDRAGEREREHEVVRRARVTASIAKKPNAIAASVAARPSMLSSRLNAFVTPTSQSSAIAIADALVADELDLRAASRARSRRRRSARASFASGLQATEVVDEAGDEDERAAGEDTAELARSGSNAPVATAASQTPTLRPTKIPIPPTSGVGASCQRSPHGAATRRRGAGVGGVAQIARRGQAEERRSPRARSRPERVAQRG